MRGMEVPIQRGLNLSINIPTTLRLGLTRVKCRYMGLLRECVSLDGGWTLAWGERDLGLVLASEVEEAGQAIEARVPGNVELDLVRAGLIPEPFFGMNAVALQQFETWHWWYGRRFPTPEVVGREAILRFEGLDCDAEVFLNGHLVMTTANALVEHEAPVQLVEGNENEIVVHIWPWRDGAESESMPVGCMAGPHQVASLRVRKPAHAFGWDIMPRIVSAGIWRPCSIELRPSVRIQEAYLRTVRCDEDKAELVLHYRVHGFTPGAVGMGTFPATDSPPLPVHLRASGFPIRDAHVPSAGSATPTSSRFRFAPLPFGGTRKPSEGRGLGSLPAQFTASPAIGAGLNVRIAGKCGDSVFHCEEPVRFGAGQVSVTVDRPMLWWPKNRGLPNLYDVAVSLLRDGEEIDRLEFRHGIRSGGLVRTSVTDEAGCGDFHFEVNGERIFVLGTNWVPVDAFHSRDAERLPTALSLLDEVGCNLVRCWGGNVYEDDAFYDFCDAHGILVWQDFCMACAKYPQDDAFAAVIGSEARKVVRRLRQHPCIAVWAGDNECDDAHGWSGLGDPNENRLTRRVIPEVLGDEDPWRPYLPSSPYMDSAAYARGARYLPENHLWGPRNSFRSDFYEGSLCHFASEIGYHGSPSVNAIRKFISEDKLWPQNNDEWLLHCTSPIPDLHLYDYRVALMSTQIEAFFGSVPGTMSEWSQASQFTQAEAYKHFIEMFRLAKWRRTGIVWWNLLDGWPQFSDAVVDYYFAKKAAFEFIRRAQSPVLVAVRECGDSLEVVGCNDLRERVSVGFSVTSSGGQTVSGEAVLDGDSVKVMGRLDRGARPNEFIGIEFSYAGRSFKNHQVVGDLPVDLGWYRDQLVGFY